MKTAVEAETTGILSENLGVDSLKRTDVSRLWVRVPVHCNGFLIQANRDLGWFPHVRWGFLQNQIISWGETFIDNGRNEGYFESGVGTEWKEKKHATVENWGSKKAELIRGSFKSKNRQGTTPRRFFRQKAFFFWEFYDWILCNELRARKYPEYKKYQGVLYCLLSWAFSSFHFRRRAQKALFVIPLVVTSFGWITAGGGRNRTSCGCAGRRERRWRVAEGAGFYDPLGIIIIANHEKTAFLLNILVRKNCSHVIPFSNKIFRAHLRWSNTQSSCLRGAEKMGRICRRDVWITGVKWRSHRRRLQCGGEMAGNDADPGRWIRMFL